MAFSKSVISTLCSINDNELMDRLTQQSLGFRGAVIVCEDLGHFKDPMNIAYEIGIQNPKGHKRFVNIFTYGGRTQVYFKHDPDEINDFYNRYPKYVGPSEVSPRYWSKAWLGKGIPEAELTGLVRRSYQLILGGLSKKLQAQVASTAGSDWNFLQFHSIALSLVDSPNVYLKYMQVWPPGLSFGAHTFVQFFFNDLLVFFPSEFLPERFSTYPNHEQWQNGTWIKISGKQHDIWSEAVELSLMSMIRCGWANT